MKVGNGYPIKILHLSIFFLLSISTVPSIGLNASSLGGRVAEVGWKFTSLAGQKAAELSENVTEKVGTKHARTWRRVVVYQA